jgi:AraC-like DNA-binding protein
MVLPMQARREHIRAAPDSSWYCFRRRGARFEFGWHFHPEVELTLLVGGCGRRLVGDSVEPYRPGDLVLIGPELPHTFVSDGAGNDAVVAQFRPDFLGAGLLAGPEFAGIRTLLDASARGLAFQPDVRLTDRIRRLVVLPPTPRTLALLGILAELAADRTARPLASTTYRPRRTAAMRTRLDTVCAYLDSAYPQPVRLAEVAALAHLSPAAFSRFFRQATGRTLTAYLTELRLAAACRLLRDTALPVADVAIRAGFGNLSYFNRRFLAAQRMRPTQYRRQFAG